MSMRDVISGAVPPRDGDADGHRRWQWAVFGKLWLLILFSVWALDVIPGFPGLARANDVQQLQANVRAIQEGLLEQSLLATRREQCKALVEDNATARAFYGEKLIELRRRYFELTGRQWERPPCDAI